MEPFPFPESLGGLLKADGCWGRFELPEPAFTAPAFKGTGGIGWHSRYRAGTPIPNGGPPAKSVSTFPVHAAIATTTSMAGRRKTPEQRCSLVAPSNRL